MEYLTSCFLREDGRMKSKPNLQTTPLDVVGHNETPNEMPTEPSEHRVQSIYLPTLTK